MKELKQTPLKRERRTIGNTCYLRKKAPYRKRRFRIQLSHRFKLPYVGKDDLRETAFP